LPEIHFESNDRSSPGGLRTTLAPRSLELLAARLTVAGLIAARAFLNIRSSNTAARAGFYGWPPSSPE
jgi:hypothetical protein